MSDIITLKDIIGSDESTIKQNVKQMIDAMEGFEEKRTFLKSMIVAYTQEQATVRKYTDVIRADIAKEVDDTVRRLTDAGLDIPDQLRGNPNVLIDACVEDIIKEEIAHINTMNDFFLDTLNSLQQSSASD